MVTVAYITDEKFVMPTCVSITSLIESNLQEEGTIYILCDNVCEDSKLLLNSVSNALWSINVVEVANSNYERIADELYGRTGIHVSKSALFKFDLPGLLNVDKVLYLDGDVIIQKSIRKMYEVNISNSYAAAVEDMGDIANRIWDAEVSLAERIGLSSKQYFNSGVMLLNLDKMRRDNISQKLHKFRVDEINYFMDQDAFNACFCGRWMPLSYEYNFRGALCYEWNFEDVNDLFFGGRFRNVYEMIEAQTILHMSDRFKPWEYNVWCLSEIYNKYIEQSPFKGRLQKYKSLYRVIQKERKQLIKEFRWLEDRYQKMHDAYEENLAMKSWSFPIDKIPAGSKVVLYGAGEVGNYFYNWNKIVGYCTMVLWCDKNYKNIKNVFAPEQIQSFDYDYVLIAVSLRNVSDEIEKELISSGVDRSKMVRFARAFQTEGMTK